MKKVLICIPGLEKANGIATLFMNNLEELNKNGYLIDFYMPSEYSNDVTYIEKIKKNNGKIYFSKKSTQLKKYAIVYLDMSKILSENDYDIVHINLINIYAYICIKLAKQNNVKSIIFHTHNPIERGNISFLSDILVKQCSSMATSLIACTDYVGKSNFKKKKYEIVHNAINTEKYIYDLEYRKDFRDKYDMNDCFVIGAIGRISKQKNPFFTLKLFEELSKKYPNTKLLFVGDGELKQALQERNHLKNVIFLESRTDVHKIYSALDLLLLPSLYEGLGIVFIEAQVSSLPVITSTNTPTDIVISDNVSRINLKAKEEIWIKEIEKYYSKKIERVNNKERIIKNGYDISSNKDEMTNIYNKISK